MKKKRKSVCGDCSGCVLCCGSDVSAGEQVVHRVVHCEAANNRLRLRDDARVKWRLLQRQVHKNVVSRLMLLLASHSLQPWLFWDPHQLPALTSE